MSLGITTRIKDRSCPIAERLRYLRLAWRSNKIYIPNKEQFIIDCLSRLLLNKKKDKIGTEDVKRIWKCLYAVLHTEKAHHQPSPEYTLVVQPSLAQVLIDNISLEYERSCDSSLYHVIGCCQSIITSPTLSHVFTSSYKTLVSLLTAVIEIVVQDLNNGRGITSPCLTLLDQAANQCFISQKATADIKQVVQMVTTKLMVPILVLHHTVSQPVAMDDLTKCTSVLMSSMEAAVFDQSLVTFYEKFLRNLDIQVHPNKVIEQVMGLLSSIINKKVTIKYASPESLQRIAVCYIPRFYDKFITMKGYGDDKYLAHKMLVHLLKTLGINLEESIFTMSGCDSIVLQSVCELLLVIQERKLYNVAQDNAVDSVQLKSYRSLLHVLLSITGSRSCWFYSCIMELVKMNHLIVEPRLSDIMLCSWLEAEITASAEQSDVHKSLSDLLCCVLQTYNRLRQWTKWTNIMLSSIQKSKCQHTVFLPQQFLNSWREVVEQLPQGTMIEIWKIFIEELKTRYLPSISSKEDIALRLVTELFCQYLSFLRVADYNITTLISGQVKDTLTCMVTDLNMPFLVKALKEKAADAILCSLQLCRASGELQLLLATYSKYDLQLADLDNINTCPVDISASLWRKVCKFVENRKDKRLQVIMNQLTFLTLRTTMMRETYKHKEKREVLSRLTRDLASIPLETGVEGPWKGLILEMTSKNVKTALFTQIVHSLPVSLAFMEHGNTQAIMNEALRLHSMPTDPASTHVLGPLMMYSRESPQLQSCILSYSLRNLSNSLAMQAAKLQKKKKLHSALSVAINVCDTLARQQLDEIEEDIESSLMTTLQSAAKQIQRLMTISVAYESEDFLIGLQSFLKILTSLPLVHLPISKKVICLLAVTMTTCLASMTTVQQHTLGSDQQVLSVLDQCVHSLAILLTSSQHCPVFSVLDRDYFLLWLVDLSCRQKSGGCSPENVELLMEASCKKMLSNFDTLGPLTDLISKLFLSPADLTESLSCDSESKIALLNCLYRNVYKLTKYSHIKEEIQSTCRSYLSSLFELIGSLVTAIRQSTSSLPTKLISCYNTSVQVMASQQESVTPDHSANILYVIDICLNYLHQGNSVEHKIEALNFLFTICKALNVRDLLSSHILLNIWNTLQSVTPYDGCQITGQQDQSCSEEGNDVEMSDVTQRREHKEDCENNGGQFAVEDSWTKICNGQHNVVPCKLLLMHQVDTEERDEEGEKLGWKLLRQRLIMEGKYKSEGFRIIRCLLPIVRGAFVTSLELDMFQNVISKTVLSITLDSLLSSPVSVFRAALSTWCQVLQCHLTKEQGRMIALCAQEVTFSLVSIIDYLSKMTMNTSLCDLVCHILNTLTLMLSYGQMLLSEESAVLSLQCCVSAPLKGDVYVREFHSIYNLVDTFFLHHTNTALSNIPNLLQCTSRLMKSLIHEGSQTNSMLHPEAELVACAQMMDRLYGTMMTYRSEFSRVVVYMVADYVTELQQVTLLPAVKRTLVTSVYKVLDICDKHVIAQLHTVLSTGVKEVFKSLYADYNKYYKYTGKV